MRGRKAKTIRRQVFGSIIDRLESRKYAPQLVPDTTSGALAKTGAVVSSGLRG